VLTSTNPSGSPGNLSPRYVWPYYAALHWMIPTLGVPALAKVHQWYAMCSSSLQVAAPVIQNRRPAIGQQKHNLKYGAVQVPKGGCPELVGSKSSEDGWGVEGRKLLRYHSLG